MKKLLLVLSLFVFWEISLKAQAIFDIQLKFSSLDTINNLIHFNVQLQNSKEEQAGLAGQNYRLFYNSTNLSFETGVSLLGDNYQSFTLIQNIQNIDASGANGELAFDDNLGFLNFSIDLINTTGGGVFLAKENGWTSIAQLSFQLTKDISIEDCLELVWGRADLTNAYATSFVELSEWVGFNNTRAAQINTYQDWVYPNCQAEAIKDYYIQPKVLLQGCYDNSTGLMRDDLRIKQLIPMQAPYSSGNLAQQSKIETAIIENESILSRTGETAIVDWMLVELRAKETPEKTSAIQAALLQRNGLITAPNGIDPLHFSVPQNDYHLVIHHRNHLGVMTAFPIELSSNSLDPSLIDFTSNSTVMYGTNARIKQDEHFLLWGGDTDNNGYIVFQGGGVGLPDGDAVFFDILSDKTNRLARYNHVTEGYYTTDANMDGQVIYQGGKNDIDDLIFFNVFMHPDNINFFTNFFIAEQIRKE